MAALADICEDRGTALKGERPAPVHRARAQILRRLPAMCIEGSVVIFVSRRGAVDELTASLKSADFACTCSRPGTTTDARSRVADTGVVPGGGTAGAYGRPPGGALHGDLTQNEREKVMRDFRKGRFPVLIATDVRDLRQPRATADPLVIGLSPAAGPLGDGRGRGAARLAACVARLGHSGCSHGDQL